MATHVGFADVGGAKVQIFIQYDPDTFDVTEVYSDEDTPMMFDGVLVHSGDEMPEAWLQTYQDELNQAGLKIWEEAPMPQTYVPPINQLG